MIDVLTKLREIAERSPEEIGRAIAAAERMSGNPVSEASEAQKAAREKFKNMLNGKKDDKDGEKKTESSGKKPDYLDFDKDGDKKEPMTKALKDKEEKKVDEGSGRYAQLRAYKKKHGHDHPDMTGDEYSHLYGDDRLKKDQLKNPRKDKYVAPPDINEDISITLSGSDAVLAEILKLAGQIGAKTTKGPEAAGPMGGSPPMGAPAPAPALPAPTGMPSSGPIPSLASMMGDEPGMDVEIGGSNMGPGSSMVPGGEEPGMGEDPMMDGAFDATTTPNPTTMGMDAAIPSGNDLSKPKMTAPRVSPGDNPLHSAMSFG